MFALSDDYVYADGEESSVLSRGSLLPSLLILI
jgi:hypothetical protein